MESKLIFECDWGMVLLANLHLKLPVNVCASCFLSSDDFFKKNQEYNQALVQTVCMRIRPDVCQV